MLEDKVLNKLELSALCPTLFQLQHLAIVVKHSTIKLNGLKFYLFCSQICNLFKVYGSSFFLYVTSAEESWFAWGLSVFNMVYFHGGKRVPAVGWDFSWSYKSRAFVPAIYSSSNHAGYDVWGMWVFLHFSVCMCFVRVTAVMIKTKSGSGGWKVG